MEPLASPINLEEPSRDSDTNPFMDDGRRVFSALKDSDEESEEPEPASTPKDSKIVRFAPLPLVEQQEAPFKGNTVRRQEKPLSSKGSKPRTTTTATTTAAPTRGKKPQSSHATNVTSPPRGRAPISILRLPTRKQPRWRSAERRAPTARPKAKQGKVVARSASVDRIDRPARPGSARPVSARPTNARPSSARPVRAKATALPRNRSASPMWRATRTRPGSAEMRRGKAVPDQRTAQAPQLRTAVRALRRSASAEPQRPTPAAGTDKASGRLRRPGSAISMRSSGGYARPTATSRCRSASPQKHKPDRALPWELRDPIPGPGEHTQDSSVNLIGLATANGDSFRISSDSKKSASSNLMSPISTSKHQFFPRNRPRPRVVGGLASPPAASASFTSLTSPQTPRTISYLEDVSDAASSEVSPRSKGRVSTFTRTQSGGSSIFSGGTMESRRLQPTASSNSLLRSTAQFKVTPGYSFTRSSRFTPAMYLGDQGSGGDASNGRKVRSQWREAMTAGDPSSPGPAKYGGRPNDVSQKSIPHASFTTSIRSPTLFRAGETGPTVGPGSYSPKASLTRTSSRRSNPAPDQ